MSLKKTSKNYSTWEKRKLKKKTRNWKLWVKVLSGLSLWIPNLKIQFITSRVKISKKNKEKKLVRMKLNSIKIIEKKIDY